jgi:uncharacterized protein (TIGR02246 family)
MPNRIVIATTLAWLGSACQPQATPPDLEAIKGALATADRQYVETTTAKNLDAFVGFYAADGAMYPPGAPVAIGHEAIRAVANSFFQDSAFTGTFHPGTVEVSADGTMGYTFSTADLTITGPDGKPMQERVRDFHLWRRQADGSWKIVLDIWNAEPPATPAPTT